MDSSLHQYTQMAIQKERKKINFQYILTLCCSLFAGGVFVSFLTDEFLPGILRQVAVHFELAFFEMPSLFRGILWMIRYSVPDLICGGICFLFSFSNIHCLIADLLLIFQGISSGFSIWLLFQIECSRTPVFANGGYFFTFLLFRLCVLTLFTVFCIQTSYIAMTQTQDLRTGRLTLPASSVKRLLLWLTAFGIAVLLLTGFYAMILYFIF